MTEMNLENMEEKTINREWLFKGHIIDVAKDTVSLPKGGTASREIVFHNGGVGIVAITPENKILLVRQFRKPVEDVLLEIPAGKIDDRDADDPSHTAYRELEEETGYTTKNLEKITAMYPSPGFSNEMLWIYFTNQLEKVDNPLPQDEDELLELVSYTLEEAKTAIANGEIKDAKTIVGIQAWELKENRGG